jgi:glycosyltransferase involved in cell wall biosynthesis
MRILLATETYLPEMGGGERQAELLARCFLSRGHEVTVVTRRSRPVTARTEVIGGVRVVRLPPTGPGRWRKWGLLFSSLPSFARLGRQHDVTLVAGFRILGVPALLGRLVSGRPVVLKADSCGELSGEYFDTGLTEVGIGPGSVPVRWGLAWRNRLLRRADAFVAMTGALVAEMREQGVDDARLHEIPNGVDTDVFCPATEEERRALRQRLELPDEPIVVYSGRLVRYKGLPHLLEAWRRLVAEGQPGLLVLLGEGGGDVQACEPELRHFVESRGLGGRVRFAGAVEAVADWLRASDVFAFPTEDEAFGLALAEAMACGLPAVTTAVGGLVDFVEDGVNALVIQPGDEQGLATGLARLMSDPMLSARLGAAGRQRVLERYAQDRVTQVYEELFGSLVGHGGTRGGG